MPTAFSDLLASFEFVSFAGLSCDNQAYICRQTGKIFWRSDFPDFAEFNDEGPDDIDNQEMYVPVPDKRELDLGKPLVFDFVHQSLPADVDEVRRIFSKRGAYQNFKKLLARRKALDRWYAFEAEATSAALRAWCEANSIAIAD